MEAEIKTRVLPEQNRMNLSAQNGGGFMQKNVRATEFAQSDPLSFFSNPSGLREQHLSFAALSRKSAPAPLSLFNREKPELSRERKTKTVPAQLKYSRLLSLLSEIPFFFIGAHGSGKTLSTAKFAAILLMLGQEPVVITTDTQRPCAVDQLKVLTDILGLRLHIAFTPQVLHQKINENADRIILIDTPAVNPLTGEGMDYLKSLEAGLKVENILILQAGLDGKEAINRIAAFKALPLKYLFMTKGDCSNEFDGVLQAALLHNLIFVGAGVSPYLSDGFEEVDREWFKYREEMKGKKYRA